MKLTKKQQRAVDAIRDLAKRTAIHDLTLIPVSLPPEAKRALEQELKTRFRLWWSTWVETQLQVIEGANDRALNAREHEAQKEIAP